MAFPPALMQHQEEASPSTCNTFISTRFGNQKNHSKFLVWFQKVFITPHTEGFWFATPTPPPPEIPINYFYLHTFHLTLAFATPSPLEFPLTFCGWRYEYLLELHIHCCFMNDQVLPLKPRLHRRFFACHGDAIFSKFVALPACSENHMCSHPRASAVTVTAEKSQKKN